jgi:hypothetical protein
VKNGKENGKRIKTGEAMSQFLEHCFVCGCTNNKQGSDHQQRARSKKTQCSSKKPLLSESPFDFAI